MTARPVSPVPLSVVVLTLNEAKNLGDCLRSLEGLPAEVLVVDSGSTDDTQAIAERSGARFLVHSFEGHARQWNWAFHELPIQGDWVLALDADHRLTPELKDELVTLLRTGGESGVDGYYLTRRQVFRGRWIRHGGYYPKHLLKLFRRGSASADERERLDFRFYVHGRTATLAGDLIEENRNEDDLDFWLTKHIRFAGLQAQEEMERRGQPPAWAVTPSLFGTPDQRVLWLKSLWYRMPLFVRPLLYFSYRYFVRLGFLDGKQGFVFHFLQGFWYRLIVDIKLDELRARGDASPRPPGNA